jgi:hypothetical protein
VVTFRYQCRDGDTLTTEVVAGPGSTVASLVTAFTVWPEDNGWRFEIPSRSQFVIRGSRTSPIRSVTFKGDVWVPVVTCRVATRPFRELAPPPREVKR